MAQDLSRFLTQTLERELPNLRVLTDEHAALPRGPGKWSPKEELGHLIDSASNNHLRFAGAAIQAEFRGPTYAQNDWVRLHGYRGMPWETIVDFWSEYNRLLATLAANIPDAHLERPCFIGHHAPVTLRFLIEDYVFHMQHHIDLLLRRDVITSYPGASAP
jgi:DinB superfamily